MANATTVIYTRSGSGAVARSAKQKFDEIVSVKDFGAIGDAVADDSGAFEAAIIYARSFDPSPATEGEGQVRICVPHGVYRLTRTGILSAGAPGKRLGYVMEGDGPGTILWLDPSAAGASDLYFYDNGSQPRNWEITFRSLTFTGGIN